MSRRLAQLSRQPALASGADTAGLRRNSAGQVLVGLHMRDTSPAAIAALTSAGASVRAVSDRYASVTAFVAPQSVTTIAALDAVTWIGEATPAVTRSRNRAAQPPMPRQTITAACPSGVVTEGDSQLRANDARAAFGVRGAGVTVGVISDSYNQDGSVTTAAQDIANGELPGAANPCGDTTAVQVIAESDTGGADEGRAMLQIIHDLAPAARLQFAAAGDSPEQMADRIRALAAAGADIIVDDIFFPGAEPFFQDGPINVAINEVAAQGVVYLAAAGNANTLDANNNNVSSYEAAAYRPTSCPAALSALGSGAPADCHNFATSGAADPTSTYRLGSGGLLAPELQWAEPFDGVHTDFTIFLIDSVTNSVVFGANEENIKQQRPIEFPPYAFQNTTGGTREYALVIGRIAGMGIPRIKYVFQDANSILATEYNASNTTQDMFGPSIGDHVASAGALGIAAVRYNDATRPERFSSLGPATHYFGPVTTTVAAALAQPQLISKPDVGATDGGVNSFFNTAPPPPYRFYGTSAAAPHAAAVVALLKQQTNRRGMAFDRSLAESLLEATAKPMPFGSVAQNGSGLIDAFAALQRLQNIQPRVYLPLSSR